MFDHEVQMQIVILDKVRTLSVKLLRMSISYRLGS